MMLNLILGVLILFLAGRGWRRGLIGEVVETVGLFVSILVVVRFYPELEALFGVHTIWSAIILAIGSLFVAMIVLHFIVRAVHSLLKKAKLGVIEKVLGMLLGLLKAGLIVAVVCAVLLRLGSVGQTAISQSVVARSTIQAFAWISTVLPDEWAAKVDSALLNEPQDTGQEE